MVPSEFYVWPSSHLVLSGIRVKFVSQSSGYYRSIYGSLIDNFLKEFKYFRRQFWRAGGTQAKKSAKYGQNRLCMLTAISKTARENILIFTKNEAKNHIF